MGRPALADGGVARRFAPDGWLSEVRRPFDVRAWRKSRGRRQRPTHGEPLWYVGMFAWLILTATAVYRLVTSGRHPVTLVVALVGVAVYAVVFVWLALTHRPGRDAIAPPPTLSIVLLAVIGVGLALVSPRALVFVFVAAAVGGLYLRPRLAAGWIGGATLVGFGFQLRDSPWLSAVSDSVQLAAIGFFCYGWARMEETNVALEAAREEVGRLAVADERVRFSRELHDLLGHTLSVIRIKSELASRLASLDPARAGEEMADVERVARAALAEVREAVSGYRPGLGIEVQNAQRVLRGAGIDATVEGGEVIVDGPVGEMLAWVVREAATNVLRHSKAHQCTIRLSRAGGQALLEVSDDGIGCLSPDAAGNGLRGIRDRVAEAGGDVEVASTPGGGLRVRVTVPMGTT